MKLLMISGSLEGRENAERVRTDGQSGAGIVSHE